MSLLGACSKTTNVTFEAPSTKTTRATRPSLPVGPTVADYARCEDEVNASLAGAPGVDLADPIYDGHAGHVCRSAGPHVAPACVDYAITSAADWAIRQAGVPPAATISEETYLGSLLATCVLGAR